MLAKKLAVLTAAMALAAPALADHGHRYDRGHQYGHYKHYGYGPRVVVHERYYYRPAPRPVYVVHRPAPVYPVYHYRTDPATGAAILVGAVLGAAIVHHAVTGY